jgi:hypothetical protein
MAKREVNAISKGRAAKGKREASQRTTYTTAGGAQQWHNRDTILDALSRIRRSEDPEIHSRDAEVYYAASAKDYPDLLKVTDDARREKESMESGKAYRQERADIDKAYNQRRADLVEAHNKIRMNRQRQSVGKFADGGKVTRGDGACMKGHTKGRMV